MSDNSSIQWTDATWNPVRGCTKVSPGCANCYAETFAERFRGVKGHPYEQGFDLPTVQRPTWCWGWGEHAHFEDLRKFKTAGMPADERHTTAGSLMLCTFHHQLYDARKLHITARDPETGCNGPLDYREEERTT